MKELSEVQSFTEVERDGLRAEWVDPLGSIVLANWKDGERLSSVELFRLPKGYSDVTRETLLNFARELAHLFTSGIDTAVVAEVVAKAITLTKEDDFSPVFSMKGVTNVGYIVKQAAVVRYVAVTNAGQVLVVNPDHSVKSMSADKFMAYAEKVRGYSIRP